VLAVKPGREGRPQGTALNELRDDLGHHVPHRHYAERLSEGRSIGSGQVEGACNNLIGRRLKQTAARRRVRRLNRMAGRCSIMYSQPWNTFWHSQSAKNRNPLQHPGLPSPRTPG
jgi:hypothetical protein